MGDLNSPGYAAHRSARVLRRLAGALGQRVVAVADDAGPDLPPAPDAAHATPSALEVGPACDAAGVRGRPEALPVASGAVSAVVLRLRGATTADERRLGDVLAEAARCIAPGGCVLLHTVVTNAGAAALEPVARAAGLEVLRRAAVGPWPARCRGPRALWTLHAWLDARAGVRGDGSVEVAVLLARAEGRPPPPAPVGVLVGLLVPPWARRAR